MKTLKYQNQKRAKKFSPKKLGQKQISIEKDQIYRFKTGCKGKDQNKKIKKQYQMIKSSNKK